MCMKLRMCKTRKTDTISLTSQLLMLLKMFFRGSSQYSKSKYRVTFKGFETKD